MESETNYTSLLETLQKQRQAHLDEVVRLDAAIDVIAGLGGTLLPLRAKPRPGNITGRKNEQRVRSYLQEHPAARHRDISKALGLSIVAVGRHCRSIRANGGLWA